MQVAEVGLYPRTPVACVMYMEMHLEEENNADLLSRQRRIQGMDISLCLIGC